MKNDPELVFFESLQRKVEMRLAPEAIHWLGEENEPQRVGKGIKCVTRGTTTGSFGYAPEKNI